MEIPANNQTRPNTHQDQAENVSNKELGQQRGEPSYQHKRTGREKASDQGVCSFPRPWQRTSPQPRQDLWDEFSKNMFQHVTPKDMSNNTGLSASSKQTPSKRREGL
jgi:hypothetical protein